MPYAASAFPLRPVAALIAAACASGAWAQATPAATPGVLETVTVTAERRAENIKDVPSSITTLGGEKLDVLNSSGQDIRFLAARVPSLNIESSFGRAFPRFYIRGFGNTDFDLNASQPVSLIFDDVVQENPVLKGFPIFDIERIEVLRGPQGTLFGRNTPAGAIRFESAKPNSARFEGYGNLSFGTYRTTNLEGAINAPITSELAIRASMQSQHRDDWVRNTYAPGPTREMEGYRDNAGRVQLLLSPSKDFSVLGNFHSRRLDGSARLFRANIIKKGSNDLVDGFDPETIATDGVNGQGMRNDGASVRVRANLGPVSVTSISGYEHVSSFSRGDIDGGYSAVFAPPSGPGVIPFSAESADGLPVHKQLTQEVRVESNDRGALKWLGGVYWFKEVLGIDSVNYDSLAGGAINGYAHQDQINRAWAVFGSVNYRISPQLEVRGGLRHTKDRKDFVADRITPPPFSSPFIGRLTTKTDASNTSGDLATTFALNPDVNVYARVATGFRAPAIQGRLLFGDSLSVADSETVRSYEAGVKADLLGKRARLAFSVFRYDIKNQQLTAVGGTANFNRLVNAKKSTGQGMELDLQAFVTDNLLITVGGSLNRTKIKDPDLVIQGCGGGCTMLDPQTTPTSGLYRINGNPLPQAPKWVFNVTARYGVPVGNGEVFVYTDWAYRSKINFFLYEAAEFTGKSLLEGGLRVGYGWSNGKYEVAAFGRNITNQTRVVGGIDFNNLTGFINEPRTLGVQFKAAF